MKNFKIKIPYFLRHYAQGSVDAVELLLDRGADPDLADAEGCRPLHLATRSCNCGLVTLLLSRGADQTAVEPRTGDTPLHIAAASGHLQLFRALLADPRAELFRPSKGSGALAVHVAARAGHVHLVQVRIGVFI